MTAADIKFSWDRFRALSPQAADLLPTNPTSPIASLSAPDDKTVVVKLNFPYLSVLDILAYNQYMLIMPRETEGGFDPKTETRGAGPCMLEKWNTGQNLIWKKQPNWYEKGLPYLDGVVETIIPDRASTLTQFEAGNLWDGGGYRPEDVLGLKKAHPKMVLYQTFPSLSGNSCWQTSRQPGNIFNDVRARQAVWMLIDRDQYMEVVAGTDRFTSAGLPVVANWNSHIPALNPEWLDPKKNELGEGAKYFHLNV